MRIEPLEGVVYIKRDSVKVGNWDTSSRDTAVESGEVLAVGDGVVGIKVGDRIFYKSWAVDLVQYNDEWHSFVSVNSKGILAKIYESFVAKAPLHFAVMSNFFFGNSFIRV